MAKKRGGNFFVWAVLGFIVVGLLGFGRTSLGGSVSSIGTVGDMRITIESYSQTLNQDIRALEAQVGTRLTFAQISSFGIDQAVLQPAGGHPHARQRGGASGHVGRRCARARGGAAASRPSRDSTAISTARPIASRSTAPGWTRASSKRPARGDRPHAAAGRGGGGPVAARRPMPRSLPPMWARPAPSPGRRSASDILAGPVAEPTEADLQAYYEANPDDFTLPETKAISYRLAHPRDDPGPDRDRRRRPARPLPEPDFRVPAARAAAGRAAGLRRSRPQADAAMARVERRQRRFRDAGGRARPRSGRYRSGRCGPATSWAPPARRSSPPAPAMWSGR